MLGNYRFLIIWSPSQTEDAMTAIFPFKLVKVTAPILAALVVSGCVTTYDDGYYYDQPQYGQYANFHEYGGPIFGYQGNIAFIRDTPYRYRIMGHRNDFLGFAYIEHDYRIRIVDPYGITLYWYYLRPDGHYHILDVNYGHLGTLRPGHRHFANFNRFSKPRVRHYRRHDIDNDRNNIRREVRDRRERGGDRDRDRRGRDNDRDNHERDDARLDRDRDRDRDSADRNRNRDRDNADRTRDRDRDNADRTRNRGRDNARSAPAPSRRPAEARSERRSTITPDLDVQVREPARRNTRRVRDNDQPAPRTRQRETPAPTAVAPSRRNTGAAPRPSARRRADPAPAVVEPNQRRRTPAVSSGQSRRQPSANPPTRRVRPAAPAAQAQPRRTPQAAPAQQAQPRRTAPAARRPAVTAPSQPASRPANNAKVKEQAKKKSADKAKNARKAKENDRRRRRPDRKKEVEEDEDR